MISITKPTADKEAYFFGTFLTDVATGLVALIAMIPAALFLGGFRFFTPWVIVIVSFMFAAGMLRGKSAGNVWLKGISLNVSCVFLMALMLSVHSTSVYTLITEIPIGVLPAVAGISFRRHRLLRSTQHSADSG